MNNTCIAHPYFLRFTPGPAQRLRLEVDSSHDLGQPICRKVDLPYATQHGGPVIDQHAMRQGVVKTENELLAQLRARHPEEEVVASFGNGNLLANFEFVAWHEGKLYRLREERVFSRSYTCIVSWLDGHISIEDLWFVNELGRVLVYRANGESMAEITEKVDFAASGQPLMRGGFPVPLYTMVERFYDTRHLVNPIGLTLNDARLFLPNAQLQDGLLRKAVHGPVRIALIATVTNETRLPLSTKGWVEMAKERPEDLEKAAAFLRSHNLLGQAEDLKDTSVLLRIARMMEELLLNGLEASGYVVSDELRPLQPGECCFVNSHLEVFFKPAVYPHNIFVCLADGTCGTLVYPGRSGRQGTTLPRAQQDLQALGVKDALLVDNGGDVRLSFRGRRLVESSEGRTEIRSLLALMTPLDQPGRATVLVS